MIRAILFDLDETLINRNETMRLFLMNQHERFPALRVCGLDIFATECLRFQNNGYADKFEAYSKACGSLGILESSLPATLFDDFKNNYGGTAVAFDGALEVVRELSRSFKLGMKTVWMRNDHFSPPDSCDEIAVSIHDIPLILSKLQGVSNKA